MDWTPGGVSSDIEDRRDDSVGGGFGGFGGFGFGHLGIGGMLFVGLLSLIFGRNFFALFDGGAADTGTRVTHNAPDRQRDAAERTAAQRLASVLAYVQKSS